MSTPQIQSFSIDVRKALLMRSNGSRGGHRTHNSLEQILKHQGMVECLDLINRRRLTPVTGLIDLLIGVSLPKNAARCDGPNYEPTVKPLIDGFTLAGLWPDDSWQWIRYTAFRYAREAPTRQPGVWRFCFTLMPVPTDGTWHPQETEATR